jgi:phenylacetic acid degradation protein
MSVYEIDGVVPVVDPTSYVHPTATLIGDVIVEADCYLGPSASLRGDFGRIVVRRGSNVQDACVVHAFPGSEAVLEEESHVGHGAILHGCRIGSGVLVGMNAVVMDGADIGAGSLIGASAFVRAGTVVPPASLVVGNPARVVGPLDDETLAWKARGVRVYQDLTRRSLAGLRPAEPLRTLSAERDGQRVSTGADVSRPLHAERAGNGGE